MNFVLMPLKRKKIRSSRAKVDVNMDLGSPSDVYAVVRPMQPQVVDDTEPGLPTSSALLSLAGKRLKPTMSAAQELYAAPLQFSKLNAEAKEILKHREELEDRQTLQRLASKRGLAALSRSGGEGEPHALEAPAGLHLPEEPVVRVTFRTSVPLAGKSSFTIMHRMTDTVATLRQHIVDAVQVRPTGVITIHRNDTGEVLDDFKSLLDCGFLFPPLLRLHGYLNEVYLTCVAPLSVKVPVPWSPAMTMADLAKIVYRRFRPPCMHHVRLSIPTIGVDGAQDGGRKVLDLSACFVAPPLSSLLPADSTLMGLGWCLSPDDPVSIRFLRTIGGAPLVFQFSFTGDTTVSAVARRVTELVATSKRKKATYDSVEHDCVALDSFLVEEASMDNATEALHLQATFDDDDEEMI
jgi:hypothetical protein